MNEVPLKIDELDPPFGFEDPRPAYRRKMPTIKDYEPTGQELGPPSSPFGDHDARRPRSRESMPTLPDIDPLRHDQPS